MEFEKYYKKLAKDRNANNFINQMYVNIQDAEQSFYEMGSDEIVIGMLEEILNAIEVAQFEKSKEIMELKDDFAKDYEEEDETCEFEMGFTSQVGGIELESIDDGKE